MDRNEVTEKINKLFNTRYSKQLVELNKNVYPCAITDAGSYEAPMIAVGPNGAIQLDLTKKDVVELPTPALVKVELTLLKGIKTVYRVVLPYNEMEIAARNESYFNYLMDAVLSKALGNYAATWGGPDVVRFGQAYVEIPDGFKDYGDDYLMTLQGSWATNEQSYE